MLAYFWATPLAAMLAVAGAAAVPVAIHLLNRNRYRVVEWAAMRFLQAAQQRTRQRLRLEQMILLAVRTAALALLAAAMAGVSPWAEPLWAKLFPAAGTAAAETRGRALRIVVLDASLSMSHERGGTSAFARAQKQAAEWVRKSPGGDGFAVVLLAGPAELVTGQPSPQRERVATLIEELRPTHGQADLAGAVARTAEVIDRHGAAYERREVLVFTDLQRGTWTFPPTPGQPLTESWQALQGRAGVGVVDVGAGPAENVAVTAFGPEEPLVIAGVPVAFGGSLVRYGDTPRPSHKVELWLGRADDGPTGLRRVQGQTADLGTSAATAVRWEVRFDRPGDYLVQMRSEADPFPLDNDGTAVVRVRERVPVLLVDGRPTGDPADRASFWVERALQPFRDAVPPPAYPARPQVVTTRQWGDRTLVDWDALEAVVLCDVPRLSDAEARRLEAFAERGGGVVVTLGPNADLDSYNRWLDRAGQGIVPAKFEGVKRATGDAVWHPLPTAEALRRPPLAAFNGDAERATLAAPPLRGYVRVVPRAENPGRVLLSLAASSAELPSGDPLLIEWPVGRGKVILCTTPLGTEWGSWPLSPGFPPLMQELLRYLVPRSLVRTQCVGEPWSESLPAGLTDLSATLTDPDGRGTPTALTADGAGLRWTHGPLARKGLYKLTAGGRTVWLATTLPTFPAGASESDLRPISPGELPSPPGKPVPVVRQASELRFAADGEGGVEAVAAGDAPRVRGPWLVRYALIAVLALWCLESWFAYRFGAARRSAVSAAPVPAVADRLVGAAALSLALMVGLMVAALGAGLASERWHEWLPAAVRDPLLAQAGVTAPASGEGLAVRVESIPLVGDGDGGERTVSAWIAVVAGVIVGAVVWREVRAVRRYPLVAGPLVLLRLLLVFAAVVVLLPQLRLVFEREGWPTFAVLIDDSQSMAATDGDAQSRFDRAKAFLRPAVEQLLADRKVKVHVWRCSTALQRVAEVERPDDVDAANRALAALRPQGETSRLGEAVRGLLGEYRGSGLAGVLFVTDGLTTEGDALPRIAPAAGRFGVPVWCVGVGAAKPGRDVSVGDVLVERTVQAGDRVVIDAQVQAEGDWSGQSIPVVLLERRAGVERELSRQDVRFDPPGGVRKLRFETVPAEAGERDYIVRVPPQSDELDRTNNQATRAVEVLAFQKVRVLLIDGTPRYEFRYLKALLERESATRAGQPLVELKSLLLDADPDAYRQDRVALSGFPATREELFGQFDVVVLGDVEPQHPQLGDRNLRWLAELVRERGGGLVQVVGPRCDPRLWRRTPLAEVLPVEFGSRTDPAGDVVAEGFRWQLTAAGRSHPALRLKAEPGENVALWNRLTPLTWHAVGATPRAGAEVLATGPESEPLLAVQFSGAGRAAYLGIEEAWRWRFRADEVHFNQFWLGLLRTVSRPRQRKPVLVADKQGPYRPGEPIRLQARFPDDRPEPPADAPVKVQVDRGGEPDALALTKLAGARGVYEAVIAHPPPGAYKFRLTHPAGDGKPPEAEATVLPAPGERDNPRVDMAALEQLAAATKGRAVPLADAADLLDDLPAFPRVPLNQARPPYVVWNQPAVLLTVVGLLTTEWLLRKRQRLL